LSSEGVFYTCLFARTGVDLRAPLRAGASDAELTQLISDTWTHRTDRYSEVRSTLKNGEQPLRKIEMYYIGG
jgi:cyclic pyranopterin phosphate synthase